LLEQSNETKKIAFVAFLNKLFEDKPVTRSMYFKVELGSEIDLQLCLVYVLSYDGQLGSQSRGKLLHC